MVGSGLDGCRRTMNSPRLVGVGGGEKAEKGSARLDGLQKFAELNRLVGEPSLLRRSRAVVQLLGGAAGVFGEGNCAGALRGSKIQRPPAVTDVGREARQAGARREVGVVPVGNRTETRCWRARRDGLVLLVDLPSWCHLCWEQLAADRSERWSRGRRRSFGGGCERLNCERGPRSLTHHTHSPDWPLAFVTRRTHSSLT